jgi:electron transfer flavoprotein alpha subunit
MDKVLIITHKLVNDSLDQSTCEKLFHIAETIKTESVDIICINLPTKNASIKLSANTISRLTGYSIILVNNDEISNLIIAQVATILNSSIVGNVIKFFSSDRVLSTKYTSKINAEILNKNTYKLYSVSTSVFSDQTTLEEVNSITQDNAIIQILPLPNDITQDNSSDTSVLKQAQCIIAGGIALKNADNFKNLIIKLAEKLKGEYAGSLVAAEQKLLPFNRHVGQTGVSVNPNLYLAVGISGAPQHLLGIVGSKKIIAINNAANAPIFEYADYGLIADLFEILPKILQDL